MEAGSVGGCGNVGGVGGGVFCGEVPGAGANEEFAVAFGLSGDGDAAKSGYVAGRGGVVAEGVLAADVAGDLGGDLVDIVERAGKVGDAAGFVGEHLERALRVVNFGAGHLAAEEQTDGVDDGAGELLDAADGLLEVERGGVVFAVGDEDDDLLGIFAVGGELVGGGDDGVVERGAAASLDVRESLAQLFDAGGEVLIDVGFVGKVDDEGFVLGIGGLNEIERGFVDGGTLLIHGAGVVDDDADGDRHVFMLEADEGLRLAVFEDAEVFFLEVVNDAALAVDDGDVECDLFDILLEEKTGAGADSLLRGGSWRRCGVGRTNGIDVGRRRCGGWCGGSWRGGGGLRCWPGWLLSEAGQRDREEAQCRESEDERDAANRDRSHQPPALQQMPHRQDAGSEQAQKKEVPTLHFTPADGGKAARREGDGGSFLRNFCGMEQVVAPDRSEMEAGIQSSRAMAAEKRERERGNGRGGVCAGAGAKLWQAVWMLVGLAACLMACAGFWTSAEAAAQAPMSSQRVTIVLDAAHGGMDSGAALGADAATATPEKVVTLALSQRLRALLTARGFAVVETRQSDAALDQDARATVANRARAVACLVLHATNAGSGVHLFVSSLAPMQPQLMMPWKTAQAAQVTNSLKLGSTLSSALGAAGRDEDSALAIPTTLGRTTLPGIDSMNCPAVAVELAPLRDKDGKVTSEVTDADYQTRVLNALAAALLEWRSGAGAP